MVVVDRVDAIVKPSRCGEQMYDPAVTLTDPPEGYGEWVADLKERIHSLRCGPKAQLSNKKDPYRLDFLGVGYDIQSTDANGWIHYIEVRGHTEGSATTRSYNETWRDYWGRGGDPS